MQDITAIFGDNLCSGCCKKLPPEALDMWRAELGRSYTLHRTLSVHLGCGRGSGAIYFFVSKTLSAHAIHVFGRVGASDARLGPGSGISGWLFHDAPSCTHSGRFLAARNLQGVVFKLHPENGTQTLKPKPPCGCAAKTFSALLF